METSRSADEVVKTALMAIRQKTSVEIQGLPGSGRSWILDKIRATLEAEEIGILDFSGIHAPISSASPLGILPAQITGDTGTTEIALSEFAHRLDQRLSQEPLVIIADDADSLSEGAVWALLVGRAKTNTPAVVVSRSRSITDTKATALDLRPSIRLQIHPWSLPEIDSLLRARLDLAFESVSLREIFNACGGLPGLALEVARCLHWRGELAEVGSNWELTGDIYTPELAPVMEKFLVGLDETSLQALHSLSVAGNLSYHAAREMSWAKALPNLENKELIHVLNVDPEKELAVYPPLLAEHMCWEGGSWMFSEAERAMGIRETSPAPLPSWDPTQSTQETTLLNSRLQNIWANETARREAEWQATPSARTTVRYLMALAQVSASSSAIDEVMAKSSLEGNPEDQALFYTWWPTYLAIARAKTEEAIAMLQDARTRLPLFDGALRAIEAHIRLVVYGTPVLDLLSAPESGEHDLSFDFNRVFAAETQIAVGRPEQALAILDEEDIRSHVGIERAADMFRGLAMYYTGEITAATEWALDHCKFPSEDIGVSWDEGQAYVASMGLFNSARFPELNDHQALVSSLTSSGSINNSFQATSFNYFASQAGVFGDMDSRRNWSDQAYSLGVEHTHYPVIFSSLSQIMTKSSFEVASQEMWKATQQAIDNGNITAAIHLGMASMQYNPDPEHATIIKKAAANCTSTTLRLVLRYVEALADPRPEHLLQVSKELLEGGLVFFGDEMATRAIMTFHHSGDHASALAIADKLYEDTRDTHPDSLALLGPFVDYVGVTEREMELLSLFATGANAKDIAETLAISVRTVEQHSLRLSRKFGVTSRTELVAMAHTWLAPFLPKLPQSR